MPDRKFDISTGKFVNRVSGIAIPDDEPVFVFRARDKNAIATLLYYRNLCDEPHHKQAITDSLEDFETFEQVHPKRMQEPGLRRHIRLKSEEA